MAGFKYDGRSRPSDDLYRKNFNDIFNKKKKTKKKKTKKVKNEK